MYSPSTVFCLFQRAYDGTAFLAISWPRSYTLTRVFLLPNPAAVTMRLLRTVLGPNAFRSHTENALVLFQRKDCFPSPISLTTS